MPAKSKSRSRKSTRGSGKTDSAGKKNKLGSGVTSDEEMDEDVDASHMPINQAEFPEKASINIEEDISKLEAPTFTTIDRGPPEPLHNNTKLKWDYKVNLIGEKVLNPRLHCCEKCSLPILIYGRMIPCKHVFCFECGKKAGKVCPRCEDKVTRVEQSALGTVYMCMHGGSRHGHNGCRRTYLSHRDLQAHISHRHLKSSSSDGSSRHKASPKFEHSNMKSPGSSSHPSRDPRCHTGFQPSASVPTSSASSRSATLAAAVTLSDVLPSSTLAYSVAPIPVMSTRTNLITVPIQDSGSAGQAAADYGIYTSSASISSVQPTQPSAASTYQLPAANPYVHTSHPSAPITYPTIPPTSYPTPISTSQVMSFSHPTHLPPPQMPGVPVAVPQIYSAPPPAVQRQPVPAPVPRPRQTFPSSQSYDEVRVGSPPYKWQGSAPRPVPPPTRPSTYRPRYY